MDPFPLAEVEPQPNGWTAQVRIPADCPAFDGHFPGRPVLPAIAQFQLLEEFVQRTHGAETSIAGFPTLRLRQTIQPDDTLTLTLEPTDAPGRCRFRMERNDEVVTAGQVLVHGVEARVNA